MKHFNRILSPALLLWLYPLLLIVPNICLSITEPYATCSKLTNVFLPIGVYYLLFSLWRKTGWIVLLSLPIAFFCAFQIVLLYLYGESIIAIDMFMNVATTNVSEATELLGNLSMAIIAVLLLYIPPLAFAIYLICKQSYATAPMLRPVRIVGISTLVIGLLCMLCAYACTSRYNVKRELFPVNVIFNLIEAVNRVGQAEHYSETSAEFKFHAAHLRDSGIPEVYVLVIGETSRADNWQLDGYERQTNPRLSQRKDVLWFGKTLSESNTTHKSVPMLMSRLTAANFGDSITLVKSIFEAFNEAGIHTAFIGNQSENHSYIDFFSSQANEHMRICSDGVNHHDHELIAELKKCVERNYRKPLFVIIHTYGSHYCYHERYTDDYRYFTPDEATDASVQNRQQLINAYDNSIRYTDAFLDGIMEQLSDRRATVVYTSDHGEDIFDDERKRFLHASPTPTYWQLHVPMLIWMSPSFKSAHKGLFAAAEANCLKKVSSSSSIFDTMLTLAGVAADGRNPQKSLCSSAYIEPERLYLNDYNEGIPLDRCGLRKNDFRMLADL